MMPSPAPSLRIVRLTFMVTMFMCLGALTLVMGMGAGRFFMTRMQADAPVAALPLGAIHPAPEPTVFAIGYDAVDFTDAVEAVRHSVVSISVSTAAGGSRMNPTISMGSGSGFIFYANAEYVFIATNNHVVENSAIITVSLDDETHLNARLVGAYPENDLAVVRVSRALLEESGKPYAIAPLGESGVLRRGDPVVAIGNALGGGQRTTQGIVSALSLIIHIPNFANDSSLELYVFQTDAAVNRGNSGGPMINQYGEVVGIITAKFMGHGVEGMGYVLPIDEVRDILEELKIIVEVIVPFMGINHRTITPDLQEMFNLPPRGQWIISVTPHTPAYYAGLERGDIIVRFGEVEITNFTDFVDALNAHEVGDTVTLGILRHNAPMDIHITLGAPPQ